MKVVLAKDAPQGDGVWWLLHRYGPSGSNFDRIICAAPTYWCKPGPPFHELEVTKHRSKDVAERRAASTCGTVERTFELSASADPYIDELIADGIMTRPNYLTAKGSPVRTNAINNGIDLEPQARDWLRMETGQTIDEVSCCFSDDLRMLCSPDGLIGLRFADCDGEYVLSGPGEPAGEFTVEGEPRGVPFYDARADIAVELKIPEPKTHIGWLREGVIPLKHRQQCHAYLAIGVAPKVLFMSYGDPANLIAYLEADEYTVAMADAAKRFVDRLDAARAAVLGAAARLTEGTADGC